MEDRVTQTTLRVRLEADGRLGVETIDGRWLALKETGDANPANTLKFLLMQATIAADDAAKRGIGRDANPTKAQHEFFERLGHSWLDDEGHRTTVQRGEIGKSGAQQAQLDAKRAKRLGDLGLTGIEDLGL